MQPKVGQIYRLYYGFNEYHFITDVSGSKFITSYWYNNGEVLHEGHGAIFYIEHIQSMDFELIDEMDI